MKASETVVHVSEFRPSHRRFGFGGHLHRTNSADPDISGQFRRQQLASLIGRGEPLL
jgi:hypothetical protein